MMPGPFAIRDSGRIDGESPKASILQKWCRSPALNYFYAPGEGLVWQGDYDSCGMSGKFSVSSTQVKRRSCPPGYSKLPFIKLSFHGGSNATTTLQRNGRYEFEIGG
jgi:hypothetical protein